MKPRSSAAAAAVALALGLTTPALSQDANLIGQIQVELKRHGYDITFSGGYLNDETRDAIADWQQRHGRPATGEPSQALFEELRRSTPVNSAQTPVPAMPPQPQAASPSARETADALLAAMRQPPRPPPVAVPTMPPGYRIVLEDMFDGVGLDSKWTATAGSWRGENGELLSSMPVPLRPIQPLYSPIASPVDRPLGLSPMPNPTTAAITAAAPIPNAFRIAFVLAGRGVSPAAINIGPYLGDDAGSGYRLVYDGEYRSALKLNLTQGSRVQTLAAVDSPVDFYDGKRHAVVWTRDRFGQMTVAIDGENAIDASDFGVASDFDGFSIVNMGGSWGIDAISVATPEGERAGRKSP